MSIPPPNAEENALLLEELASERNCNVEFYRVPADEALKAWLPSD
jgi:hypothetical protein